MDVHPDFGPWQSHPRLAILIPCGDRPTEEIFATAGDVLGSTFQNYAVSISGAPVEGVKPLSDWLRDDKRFVVATRELREVPAAKFVAVLPAGWRVTRYSLEALLSAIQLPGVAVVRALVEGHSRPVEIWDRDYLVGTGQQDATKMARTSGLERWIDGSSLGLYAHGHDAPKVFFRKGPADRHILEFIVYDAKKEAFKQFQRRRIDALEREVRSLKSQTKFVASKGDTGKTEGFFRLFPISKQANIASVKRFIRGRTQ